MMQLHSERLLHPKRHLTAWHQHPHGQIYLLTRGMMAMETERQQWAMTSGSIGWLPPLCQHQAQACGNVEGWSLYLPAALCSRLPPRPQLTRASTLAQALVERIACFPVSALTGAQRRMLQVLFDEMQGDGQEALQLPLPQDARLQKIARALLADPANTRRQDEWASWAGLSVRNLSRLFITQTGIGFARWRQQARVIRSLEALSRGEPIAAVAAGVGYDNVSAYIAAFRQRFGVTPGMYFR
ncbi:helix-turn-helix domain-containing protein [Serratia sp. AKBS12]|uniref:AraC family transcriptional regulator n=1 Tax=Serratia sp. AKBS12 TaxID=2974597 RepID=UPI0021666E4F|nr:helix-turn-helix transcriptional regulator [Serratia sp. AKBS12]MCS3409845.1 helix-turn-helix transcriptional regulator [Serratia sp. AKBS12]